MRIKIRVLTKRQEEAAFVLNHGRSAFGDPSRDAKGNPKADPGAREPPPPIYGSAESSDVGVG